MPTPLKKHLRFHATSDEQLSRAVEQTLGARLVQAPDRAFSSVGHQFALPRSELWYCSYSEPTTLRFAAGDYLRVQVPRSGTAVTRTEGRAFAVGSGHGCISSSEATIEFGAGFQQIAWRVSREELVRKLAAISGQPCTKPLRFDPEIDLEAPFARGVSTIVNSLVTCIDTLPAESRSLVVTELEEALVVALLGGAQHSLRSLLERRIDRPATWQVRRIERFIDANCDRPIGIEELVALSGSSARSIIAPSGSSAATARWSSSFSDGWNVHGGSSPIPPTGPRSPPWRWRRASPTPVTSVARFQPPSAYPRRTSSGRASVDGGTGGG